LGNTSEGRNRRMIKKRTSISRNKEKDGVCPRGGEAGQPLRLRDVGGNRWALYLGRRGESCLLHGREGEV